MNTNRLNDRIARVTEYIIPNETFPIAVGSHTISQLQSEVYEVDDRPVISVDIRLWCPQCNQQIITDTTIPNDDFETLRLLKWYSIAQFTTLSCE